MTIVLEKGKHLFPEEGMCLMEAVSFVVGERFSDHPSCVSPALAGFGRTLNDGLPYEQRQQLIPLIPKLIGTVNPEKDQQDGLRCAHWIIAHWLPTWLDLVPELKDHSTALRELPESYLQTWAGVTNDAYRAACVPRGNRVLAPVATRRVIFGTRRSAMVMAQLWEPDSSMFAYVAQAAVAACETAVCLEQSLKTPIEQLDQDRFMWNKWLSVNEAMYMLSKPLKAVVNQLQQDSVDLFTELIEGRQ
jgi:hypothetical protein